MSGEGNPEELARSAELEDAFPILGRVPAWRRRELLKAMGAAIALAGLDGCERQPDERALPYVRQPVGEVPGEARFYATAVELDGVAQPVLGKTRSGRPIKLEGNPDHPASGGKSDAFTQAALLGLYDPERSRAVLHRGQIANWDAFDAMTRNLAQRLDATAGAGFALLTGPVRSPTLLRQIAALSARWPQFRWHAWSPIAPSPAHALADAQVIVCLDDDPLGPGPLQTWHARGWAGRRAAWQEGKGEALLLVAEPSPTLTGIAADERLIAGHGRMAVLLAALTSGDSSGLDPREQRWVARAGAALERNRGKGVVTLGPHHSPEFHEMTAELNARLGNPATVQVLAQPVDGLLADMRSGRVETLLVIGANPAHGAAGFAHAAAGVPLRIHAGLHADETASLSHWHAPLAHDLESWGDGLAADGSACLIQPLVRPWLDVRSKSAILAGLAEEQTSDHDLVRETWRERWQGEFEDRWREALNSGVADNAPPPHAATPPTASASASATAPTREEGLTLLVRPDPSVWDGRFASNPWLQELPRPLTKIVWGNAIHISPALAQAQDIEEGDELELTAEGKSVVGPAAIVPGQECATVLVHLGYGRKTGTIAKDLGFNAAIFGPAGTVIAGANLRKTGKSAKVPATQRNFETKPGEFVRTVPTDGASVPTLATPANTYPPLPMTSPSWGMAIDLDLCIGCNACVAACTAENNVPMVGAEEVAKGREMHWLRVDRYQEGDASAPRHSFQPVPCMHCEDAPCEMGCPVNAAVHSPDGLNLQVYNRCIGTRTCSAYCPYKVRRFNWLDYTADDPPELQAARNPEVTVRARGVMEKCTYCIQRLQNERINGEVNSDEHWAEHVQTACEQACPTHAIVFGDVSDPASAVSRRKAKGRNYALLEEANTRPRTTYLARIVQEEGEK